MLNGKLIRQLREQKGWDQRKLARTAGIHHSVLSRLEREVQNDVRLSVVLALATALDVSVETLLKSHRPELSARQISPELQDMVSVLQQLSDTVQKQAAGILRGYVSTLEGDQSSEPKT